jgi:hypothetical protein
MIFPDEQPGYPPNRSVELGINVEEGTKLLSKPAYPLSPAELNELNPAHITTRKSTNKTEY